MTRILVVEDEESFSDPLSYLLRKEGYEVDDRRDRPGGAGRVRPQRRRPRAARPHAARAVRAPRCAASCAPAASVPVIMLTAKDSEIDKVVGLELGADDYVTKPYSSRELLARIRAVLRRGAEPEDLLAARRSRPARCGWTSSATPSRSTAQTWPLPLKEFELLELLLRNAGRVLTRGQLIDRVWGTDYVGDTKTLDVHVKRLRSKIEPDPGQPALPGDGARPRLQVRAAEPAAAGRACRQLRLLSAMAVAERRVGRGRLGSASA